MEFPPDAPDAPQAPPSDGAGGPTNDPRPLGGRERKDKRPGEGAGEEEGQPTNDPRPLGGARPPAAVQRRQEQRELDSAWKDPVQEAEGAGAAAPDAAAGAGRLALVSSAAGAAADVLHTARDKASTAASAAASAASGALEAGKAALTGADSADEPRPRHVDEVDLTPEEQLTRHHVELDPGKLHHWPPRQEGAVERMKHAAENVVHKVEHLLPGGSGQRGGPGGGPEGGAVTLEGLKFKETMDMAKNAEGRNAVDDKGRLVAQGTAAGGGGGATAPEAAVFPETLQQAIEGISEEPAATPTAAPEDDVAKQAGADTQEGNEPDPFGVTSGARSKL